MINRPDYIAAIEPFIDKPLVKILAGIRRCGKSTIFEMLREELLRRGIWGGPDRLQAVHGDGYSREHHRQADV